MCSGKGVLQEAWYSAEVCSRHGRRAGLTAQAWLPSPVSICVFIFMDWTTYKCTPLHVLAKIHILYTYFIGNMWFTKVDSNLLTLSYFLTVILTHSYCFLTVILPVVTVWSCLTCQWRLGTMEWQRTSTGSVSKLKQNITKYIIFVHILYIHHKKYIKLFHWFV